jgi:hypothetical protein
MTGSGLRGGIASFRDEITWNSPLARHATAPITGEVKA